MSINCILQGKKDKQGMVFEYSQILPEIPSSPVAADEYIPYSWEEINAIALSGHAQDWISVGALKSVTLNKIVLGTTTHDVRVIGINQDNDQSITFQTKNCLASVIPFSSNSIAARWKLSDVRNRCVDYYDAFPEKKYIKPVYKGVIEEFSGYRANINNIVTYYLEIVWLPSEREMGLDLYAPIGKYDDAFEECTKNKDFYYEWYDFDDRRIKDNNNNNIKVYQWLRSNYYEDQEKICVIRTNGKAGINIYSNTGGIAPAFVIGVSSSSSSSSSFYQDDKDITDLVKTAINEDFYTKEESLNEETMMLYGLETDAVPNDVLIKILELIDDHQSSQYIIPNYWQNAVDEAVDKVKVLQDKNGSQVVNFLFFSDVHYIGRSPDTQYTNEIGNIAAAIMDKCNIPFALMGGDAAESDCADVEEYILQDLQEAADVMAPIGSNNLLQVRGNHDDVWGSSDENGTTTYYVNKILPSKVWNQIHRGQMQDFRRVAGGDGTFFYIDNIPQKVRFICLNTHYYAGDEVTAGTTKIMTTGLGNEQLTWLASEALPVDKIGWSVVILMHVPPAITTINGTNYGAQIIDNALFRGILEAYNTKGSYSGSYNDSSYSWMNGSVSVNYENNKVADLIGVFSGHCHIDSITKNDLPCPIITITSAANLSYDKETEGTRTLGTTTETALDIVSIDKVDKSIYLTRLGIGNDRSCSYLPMAYTNLFNPEEATLNSRINSSNNVVALNGFFITAPIECVLSTEFDPVILHIRGINHSLISNSNVKILHINQKEEFNGIYTLNTQVADYIDENGDLAIPVGYANTTSGDDTTSAKISTYNYVYKVQLVLPVNTNGTAMTESDIANVIITKNQLIPKGE